MLGRGFGAGEGVAYEGNSGMAKRLTKADCDNVLQEIGNILFRDVQTEMGTKEWSYAFVDIRGSSTCRIHKLRLVLPDGSKTALLDTPLENVPIVIDDLFLAVWKTKDKVYPHKWHGLKLLVYPDGRSEVKFNYDAKCAQDPTFFDE